MLDDKYRIERLLAVGGMGAVYVGTHIKLRKRVAIKVLNPQLSSGPMIERFHREAITASQIGHEGIAQVTDIGTSSEGEPFLVMEYLEGESLASRLRASGPLAIEDACELGCAILSPLAAAHHAGIVHRDLKPDNVFLVRQSRGEMVKLLDFGISRTAGHDGEFRLTTTGLVLGTPYYMSPEQARGDSEITPAADLYAFGVMLYEMLIGSVPIQADNYNQLMFRVMTGDFVRPRQRRPDLPDALEQLILQAMAQEAAHRPRSAAELEQALLPWCRPAFREHASGRLSSPGLLLKTPAPLGAPGTGPGFARSAAGTDHTMLAGSGLTHPAATGALGVPTRPEAPRALAGRRSRAPWIVVGVLALGGGVAAALVLSDHGESPSAGPTTPAPPAATVTPAPPAPPTPPAQPGLAATVPPAPPPQVAPDAAVAAVEPAPAATTVTLRFAIEPVDATVLVDGKRVTSGELVVDKDDAAHTLKITAPGYAAHSESVKFDENQRLVVQLTRASGRGHTGTPRKDPGHDRIDPESPY